MNPWQLAQQIKHELAQVAWPGGARDVVFGSRGVFVYAGAPPTDEEHPPGFPFALVTIGAGTPDADDPDLIEQTFSIVSAVEVAGDPLGENAVIGGSRTDYGRSAGAGVAEVAERVRSAVQSLTAYDGAAVVVSGSGTGAPTVMGRGRQLALDEFTVSALCTSAPRYFAPQELTLRGEVWSWSGAWATPRFDFVRFTLGYTSNDEPVATPNELDVVIYNGTNTEYAEPAIPGRIYQIFADYNGHGGTVPSDSSTPELGSYLRL